RRRGGDVVAARRRDVAERRDDGLRVPQADDLVVDLLRRRDAAARRVDAEDDSDDGRVLPERLERLDERRRVADLARELDDADGGSAGAAHPLDEEREPDDREPDADQPREPSEPRAPLRHGRLASGTQALPLSRASSSLPRTSANENLPLSRSR